MYDNNCCQIDNLCKDTKFQGEYYQIIRIFSIFDGKIWQYIPEPWNSHVHKAYRRFKPESIMKKMKQFCGTNNLLHYVLTDLTITTILKTCSGNFLLIYIWNFQHVLSHLLLNNICKLHWNLNTMFVCQVHFLLIYIRNFHFLSNLLLIYICKLHWIHRL